MPARPWERDPIAWLWEVVAGSLEAQATAAAAFVGRHLRPDVLAQCLAEAEAGRLLLCGRTPEETLSAASIRVVSVARRPPFGVALRALLDLDQGELLIYEDALEGLIRALKDLSVQCPVSPRRIVLAHEAFHVLAPGCPEKHAEVAAHLFATHTLALPFYAGLLDVAQALHQRRGP